MGDDERRRPIGAVAAGGAPQLAAGGGVEHGQDAVAFVIEQQDQPPVVEHRPDAFAEGHEHSHLQAEVLLPDGPAGHVVGVDAARAEGRVDTLTVGGRRVRREAAVLLVIALVRRRGQRCLLPHHLAGEAIERDHLEAMLLAFAVAAAAAAPAAAAARPCLRLGAGRLRRGSTRRDGSRQEDAVAPDDRARMAPSRNLDFPRDIPRVAPLGRRAARRHPGVRWSAPMRPPRVSRRTAALGGKGRRRQCDRDDRSSTGGAPRRSGRACGELKPVLADSNHRSLCGPHTWVAAEYAADPRPLYPPRQTCAVCYTRWHPAVAHA